MSKLQGLQRHVRSHLLAYVALFLALSVAPAWALARNSVKSGHIVDGQVRRADIKDGAVNAPKIRLPLNFTEAVDNDDGPPFVSKEVLRIQNTGTGDGLVVSEAGSRGVVVGGALGDPHLMTDGIRILETGDDGIQIGSDPDYPSYGVYIPSPGVPNYGLWPNTADANGEWALFTVDKIEAGNVASPAYTVLAKVSVGEVLHAGEIVTPSGVSAPIPGGMDRLVSVRAAAASDAVVGVVQARMVLKAGPKKADIGLGSAPGPARAGDYVALTATGVADVRLAAGVEVARGDRLTATSGLARPLRTTRVDGIRLAEDASIVGVALGAPNRATRMVPVFVMPR